MSAFVYVLNRASTNSINYDGYYMAYKPITLLSFNYIHGYELLFFVILCDVCNEVHEHMKLPSE